MDGFKQAHTYSNSIDGGRQGNVHYSFFGIWQATQQRPVVYKNITKIEVSRPVSQSIS